MSKELDKVNEIQHTKAIYKADGTTVIESSWFNLLVAYAKEALQRLEAIDNAKPSEELECVDKILGYFGKAQIETMTLSKCNVLTIKQALLKAQEPKQYLKWEDLEFKEEEQTMKVKLNNKIYTMFYCSDEVCFDTVSIAGVFIDSCSQQFFNDLHLERVEE